MKKVGKGLGVLTIAILAIGINVVGFKRTKENQQLQQVDQIAESIVSQKKQLTTLEEMIDKAYIDEKKEFLEPTLTKETVDKIENNLARMKVSAEDFDVHAKALPDEVSTFAKKKEDLQIEFNGIKKQFNLQSEILALFTNDTIDWQTVTNDVVLTTDVTEKQLNDLKDKLQAIEIPDWRANAEEYVSFAQAQFNRIQELNANFDEMLDNDTITESATYDRYYSVSESIAQVRNPEIKAQFLEQLDSVSQQLGMGSVY